MQEEVPAMRVIDKCFNARRGGLWLKQQSAGHLRRPLKPVRVDSLVERVVERVVDSLVVQNRNMPFIFIERHGLR